MDGWIRPIYIGYWTLNIHCPYCYYYYKSVKYYLTYNLMLHLNGKIYTFPISMTGTKFEDYNSAELTDYKAILNKCNFALCSQTYSHNTFN